MNTLLNGPTEQLLFTIDHRSLDTHRIITSRSFIARSSTTASIETIGRNLVAASEMTTSGVTLPATSSPEVTQKAVNELRRLSGLTWDQLAKLFNVSRRSLHSWASGERLKPFNEETLNRLLGTIQYIDRGSASLNRSLLLQPVSDGRPLLDLLVVGKYEEVKQILGTSNAPQKPKLGALSEDARLSRMPPNPADLVDALQDTIHHEVGRSRPARTARSRKNSSGQ
ncbi:XRE family transcriptional regulator [Nostoc sp. UHCC 0926]|uniref:XRE family transcriptional regulator n=1 Tax=unclassified Nostoc TaxID=2593658 RepID=UPI00236179E5|nr:XRE family transcriptional regulator [Nostoc sp. UHCC 0926]WDD30806.1 XRE family transcriptional regulator [Nostoc sp. UHCC 0926]